MVNQLLKVNVQFVVQECTELEQLPNCLLDERTKIKSLPNGGDFFSVCEGNKSDDLKLAYMFYEKELV